MIAAAAVLVRAQVREDLACSLVNPQVAKYLTDSQRLYRDVFDNNSIISAYATKSDTMLFDRALPAVISLPADRPSGMRLEYALYLDSLDVHTIEIPDDATDVKIMGLIPRNTYVYSLQDADNNVVKHGYLVTTGEVRMFCFPTVPNMRDLGGWRVADGRIIKFGMLYRGTELRNGWHNYASDEDLAGLRALGIGAELDFRDATKSTPERSPMGDDVRYLYVPMEDCESLLADNKENFAKAFHFILQNMRDGVPTYMHCIYGADRTGVFCVLLQGLLGVSIKDIYRDYELTTFSPLVQTRRNKLALNRRLYYFENVFPPSKDINTLTEEYAINEMGLTREEIDEFRELMLEKEVHNYPDFILTPVHAPVMDGYYNIQGLKMKNVSHGLNLVRQSDGNVRKVLVK